MPESELMLFDNIAWQTGILFFHIAKNKNLTFDKIFGIVDIHFGKRDTFSQKAKCREDTYEFKYFIN